MVHCIEFKVKDEELSEKEIQKLKKDIELSDQQTEEESNSIWWKAYKRKIIPSRNKFHVTI